MLSFYAGLFVSLSQGLGLLYVFSLRFLSPVQYFWGEWNLKLVKKEHLYAETVFWSTKHIVELIPMKTTVSGSVLPKVGPKGQVGWP